MYRSETPRGLHTGRGRGDGEAVVLRRLGLKDEHERDEVLDGVIYNRQELLPVRPVYKNKRMVMIIIRFTKGNRTRNRQGNGDS